MKDLKEFLNESYLPHDIEDANRSEVVDELKQINQKSIDKMDLDDWNGSDKEIPGTSFEISCAEDRNGKFDVSLFNSAYTKDGGYLCTVISGLPNMSKAIGFIKNELVKYIKKNSEILEFEYIPF